MLFIAHLTQVKMIYKMGKIKSYILGIILDTKSDSENWSIDYRIIL